MKDTTPIEGMARARTEAMTQFLEATMRPDDDLREFTKELYRTGMRAALQWLHDNETEEEIEVMAKAIDIHMRELAGLTKTKWEDLKPKSREACRGSARDARSALLKAAMKEAGEHDIS